MILSNALTIDVEDYFQAFAFESIVERAKWMSIGSRAEANTDRLLEILDEASVKGTFFVLGWIAERFPSLVDRIAASGHEVASYGFWRRRVYTQTREEFRDDVRRAKDQIEAAAGVPVAGYRAPGFSIVPSTRWALEVLVEEGYRYDASIVPIRQKRYGSPNVPRHPHYVECAGGPILEIPASTVRVRYMDLPVTGTGYIRLLPYAYTAWGIHRVNRIEGRPAVLSLHSWEIDPEQPRLRVPGLARFRHYHNLHRTEGRLRRVLREFQWGPLADWLAAGPAVVPIATWASGAAEFLV